MQPSEETQMTDFEQSDCVFLREVKRPPLRQEIPLKHINIKDNYVLNYDMLQKAFVHILTSFVQVQLWNGQVCHLEAYAKINDIVKHKQLCVIFECVYDLNVRTDNQKSEMNKFNKLVAAWTEVLKMMKAINVEQSQINWTKTKVEEFLRRETANKQKFITLNQYTQIILNQMASKSSIKTLEDACFLRNFIKGGEVIVKKIQEMSSRCLDVQDLTQLAHIMQNQFGLQLLRKGDPGAKINKKVINSMDQKKQLWWVKHTGMQRAKNYKPLILSVQLNQKMLSLKAISKHSIQPCHSDTLFETMNYLQCLMESRIKIILIQVSSTSYNGSYIGFSMTTKVKKAQKLHTFLDILMQFDLMIAHCLAIYPDLSCFYTTTDNSGIEKLSKTMKHHQNIIEQAYDIFQQLSQSQL